MLGIWQFLTTGKRIAKKGKHYFKKIIMPLFSTNDKCGQNNFVGQTENNYLFMHLQCCENRVHRYMQLAQDTNLFIRNFKHAQ